MFQRAKFARISVAVGNWTSNGARQPTRSIWSADAPVVIRDMPYDEQESAILKHLEGHLDPSVWAMPDAPAGH